MFKAKVGSMRKGLKSRVHFVFQDAPFHVSSSSRSSSSSFIIANTAAAAATTAAPAALRNAAAKLADTNHTSQCHEVTPPFVSTQAASTLTEEQVARFGGSQDGLTWFQW